MCGLPDDDGALGVIGYCDIIRHPLFMVRRMGALKQFDAVDAGTGVAALRVKTCGSVGGRE